MLNKIYKKSFLVLIILLPMISFGVQLGETSIFFTNLYNLVKMVLVPLVFTLALLFFFWGVAKYIWSEGTEKAQGKQIMIWGVVALFVMSSIWGLVYFIQDELGITDDGLGMPIPTIKQAP
ncbi:MAG: hypothetical protein AAB350_00915 [Patescibacteria group bacterium]